MLVLTRFWCRHGADGVGFLAAKLLSVLAPGPLLLCLPLLTLAPLLLRLHHLLLLLFLVSWGLFLLLLVLLLGGFGLPGTEDAASLLLAPDRYIYVFTSLINGQFYLAL